MKIKLIFLISISILLGTDCRKRIKKYPLNMFGLWVQTGGYSFCDHMRIEINRDGTGKYYTLSPVDGCDGKSWSGKVKYSNDALWIGVSKFEFEVLPQAGSGFVDCSPDGLKANYGRYRMIAQMTLKNSYLHNSDIISYAKVIEY